MVKTLNAKKMALVSQKEVIWWVEIKAETQNQIDLGLNPHLTLFGIVWVAYCPGEVEIIIMHISLGS